MTDHSESERVSLSPSGLNYLRPFYMGRAWLAAGIPLPLILLGAILQSSWLLAGGVILSGVAQLLAIRGQRDAFFTVTRIHCGRGLLGLSSEDVPIRSVDQVLVDPMKLLPGMGHLTVQAGQRYLRFECVPNAEGKARRILALAQAARERYTTPAEAHHVAEQADAADEAQGAPVWPAEVPPCAPAGRMDAGTASQLIRSVGLTRDRAWKGRVGLDGRSPHRIRLTHSRLRSVQLAPTCVRVRTADSGDPRCQRGEGRLRAPE
jgi:hypothetical protein